MRPFIARGFLPPTPMPSHWVEMTAIITSTVVIPSLLGGHCADARGIPLRLRLPVIASEAFYSWLFWPVPFCWWLSCIVGGFLPPPTFSNALGRNDSPQSGGISGKAGPWIANPGQLGKNKKPKDVNLWAFCGEPADDNVCKIIRD